MIRKKGVSATVAAAPIAAPPGVYPGWTSIAGGLLLWLSFPPVGWTYLTWIAPLPWLWLVVAEGPTSRRFYCKVWIGGVVHWLLMLQGIRLAHPANYLGWLALSLYLAVYLPAFIGLTRAAVREAGVPLLIAAPTIWTALELVRGYLFTGFSIALLGHTQFRQVWLIQIADVLGAYGVSFVVMAIAAAILQAAGGSGRRRLVTVAVAATLLVLTLGYGAWRISGPTLSDKPLRVALLQGTRDKVFVFDPRLEREGFDQYRGLMKQARDRDPPVDVIVWPEGSFTELVPDYRSSGSPTPPPAANMTLEEFRFRIEQGRRAFADKVQSIATEANLLLRDGIVGQGDTHLIVGVTTVEFHDDQTHQRNSALWIDPQGVVRESYFKTHPVMFGEYIPFGRIWPWLYSLTPMPQGLTPGEGPVLFEVDGYRLTPSICFESTVPHVVRRQVRQLTARGDRPDVLISVSDDGWFWGSSILDLQLAGGVFRATELRRPFLVAANTGITAAIDGTGRIQQELPRREAGIVVAEVTREWRTSAYERIGDTFAGLCLLATVIWHLGPRFKRRSRAARSAKP